MEKFVPVVVIKELSETDKILTALKNNGINTAEITFRTACAKEAIEYAVKNYPEMSIGAGTVINEKQCEDALEAGAHFIVSPGLSVAVANICNERNRDHCHWSSHWCSHYVDGICADRSVGYNRITWRYFRCSFFNRKFFVYGYWSKCSSGCSN